MTGIAKQTRSAARSDAPENAAPGGGVNPLPCASCCQRCQISSSTPDFPLVIRGPSPTFVILISSFSNPITMRKGILAGGNFIIDYVKLINGYPEQDMLADIRSETSSNGGGPYNVLKDLAAMRADYPLSAAGLVGKDANGDWILRDCQKAGIDTAQLRQTDKAPTS